MLYNWLFARHHGGAMVFRVDDTDTERSTEEFLEDIIEGLRWLGLDWDEGIVVGGPVGEYRQSRRLARRDIAMVFQSYALYPHMSVYDNMAFGLKLRKIPKAEIDQRVRHAATGTRHRVSARIASQRLSLAVSVSVWQSDVPSSASQPSS